MMAWWEISIVLLVITSSNFFMFLVGWSLSEYNNDKKKFGGE